MARRTFISVIILVSLFILSPFTLLGQDTSRIPEDPLNWLQVTNAAQLGGLDPVMVVFFQVPDDHVGPIYFGIRDPEGDNDSPDFSGGTNTDTRYYLFGGDGCYTDSAARTVNYGDETSATGHLTAGTQLAQLWYNYLGTETGPGPGANVTADGQWVYFPAVSADEGEHVGSFYYFRVVVDGQNAVDNIKNAFQLIASGGNGSAPADISTIKAFSYSWCVDFQRVLGNTWHFYPFVPESASLTDELDLFVQDSDSAGPYSLYDLTNNLIDNTSEPPVAWEDWEWSSDTIGDGTTGTDYPFQTGGVDQRNGTWHIAYPTGGGSLDENTVEIHAQNSVTNEDLRIYSQFYQPAQADHVTVSHDSTETGALRTVTLQIVDSSGEAVPYIRNIYIDNPSTTLRILDAAGAVIGGVVAGDSYTITTNSNGYVTFTCSNTVDETVTLSFVTDGITTDGSAISSRLPASGALGTNETVDVTHESGNRPTMVSNGVSITEGNPAAGIDFTVTDVDGGYITAGNNICIRIPDGVDAVFDNTITNPGLVMNGGAAATGAVANPVTYSGDNKTVYLDVTTTFASSDYVDITGLAFTSATGPSLGDFLLSFSGQGGPYNVEDSLTAGNDIVITGDAYFVWDGVGGVAGDLTDANNWDGGVAPTLTSGTTSKVILTSAGSTPQLDSDYYFKELRIEAGAAPVASGTTIIDVSGTYQNSGTLSINGTASDVSFSGNAFSGTPSLGNVILDDTGTGTLNYAVFDDLTVNSGAWTFPNNHYYIYGNLTLANGVTLTHPAFRFFYLYGDFTNNGATITNNLVTFFSGSDQATITGATTFYQLICTVPGKKIYFDTTNDQTVSDLFRLNGTSASPITLRGTTSALWTISTGASTVDISYVDADYAEAGTANIPCDYSTLRANCDTTGFQWTNSGTVYTWEGDSGTGVGTNTNWSPVGIPGAGDSVIIGPGTPDDPLLTGAWNLGAGNVTISSGGTLVTDGFTVTCDELAIEAGGVLDMTGGGTISSTSLTNDGEIQAVAGVTAPTGNIDVSGTVRYYGAGVTLPLGNSYYNLIFNGAAWTADAALDVAKDLTVASGSFGTNGNVLTLAGDLLIIGGTCTIDTAFTLNGDLLNTGGTFTATGNTVTIPGGTHQIYGSNSWNNFTCPAGSAGAVIRFEDGTTQTIATGATFSVTGAAGNLTTLTGTGSGGWILAVTDGNAAVSVQYADISYSTASLLPPYEAYNSDSANGNNTGWYIFSGSTAVFTWEGDVSAAWNTGGNWDTGQAPLATADVTIPDVAPNNFPVLDVDTPALNDLIIASGATLATAGYDLTVSGELFNTGTLILTGVAGEAITIGTMDVDSGTVRYADGGADGTISFGGATPDLWNLEIDDGGAGNTYTLSGNLTLDGNLTVTAGNLAGVAETLTVAGDAVLDDSVSFTGAADLTFSGGVSSLAGAVSTTGGTIRIDAAADLTMAGSLNAGAGGTVDLNMAGNSLLDADDTNNDITADIIDISMTADPGAGTNIGNATPDFPIDTATAAAAACSITLPATSTAIFINHTGSATIGFGGDRIPAVDSALLISATGALTMPGNTVATGAADLTLSGSSITLGAGSLTSSTGAISLTASGAGLALTGTISSTGNVTLSSAGDITQTGTVTAANLAASTTVAGAAINLNAANDADTIDLQSFDSGNITYVDSDGFDIVALSTTGNINLTGGNALTQTGTVAAAALAVTTRLDAGAAITLGLANAAASVNLQALNTAGTLPAAGNITYTDTDGYTLAGLSTNGDVNLTSGATLTLGTAPTLTGGLSVTTVDLADGGNDVALGGDAVLTVSSGTPTAQTNTWTFNGGAAQSLTSNGFALNNLTVTNSSGGLTTGDALSLDGALVVNGAGGMTAGGNLAITGNLTLTAGYLDMDGFDLSAAVFSNGTNLYLNGGQTVSFTTMDTDSGTVIYDGAGTDLGGLTSFYDLTLAGTGNRTFPAAVDVYHDLDASADTGTHDLSANTTVLTFRDDAGSTGTYTPPGTASDLTFYELAIEAGNTLTAAGDIYVTGNWTNSGAFTHGGNMVEFLPGAVSLITGNTTFSDLRCDLDTLATTKTISFADSSSTVIDGTLFIRGDDATHLVTMSSPTATGWTLSLTNAGLETVEYAAVQYGQVGGTNDINASNSIDLGLTCDTISPGWVFAPKDVIWWGNTDSNWFTDSNWDWGYVPNDTDNVQISTVTNDPEILNAESDVITNNLIIDAGCSLRVETGRSLTVNGLTYNNLGTLYREGTSTVNVTDIDSGTTIYTGSNGTVQNYFAGADYFALEIDGVTVDMGAAIQTDSNLVFSNNAILDTAGTNLTVNGTVSGAGTIQSNGAETLDLNGNVTVNAFDFTGGTPALTAAADFTPSTFTAGSSTVTLDSGTAADLGDLTGTPDVLTFYNLNINKTAGTIVQSTTNLTVTNGLTLTSGNWQAANGANPNLTHTISNGWDGSTNNANFDFIPGTSTVNIIGGTISQRSGGGV